MRYHVKNVWPIALPGGAFILVNTTKKACRVANGTQKRPNRGMSHRGK